jgi:hypothetical protein
MPELCLQTKNDEVFGMTSADNSSHIPSPGDLVDILQRRR